MTLQLRHWRKFTETIEIYSAKNSGDIYYAIKNMVVRGAPAIGVTAAYGLAMGIPSPFFREKSKVLPGAAT